MSALVVVRLRDGQEMIGREPFVSAARQLLGETGCTVEKWRKRSSGVAMLEDPEWRIEVPEPRGPVAFATLAHEVGHQMLHRRDRGYLRRRARWLEELEAWEYALEQFRRLELPQIDAAIADAAGSIEYAAAKALRRTRSREQHDRLRDEILGRLPEWVWPALDVRTRITSELAGGVQRS